MLLLLLPILAAALIYLDLAGSSPATETGVLRIAVLKTSVLCGVYLAAMTELLSLFNLIGRWPVAAGWGLALLLAAGWGWRKGFLRIGFSRLAGSLRCLHRGEALLGLGLGLMLALLFVILIYAPTNNSDSLQYHMSRVMHWAQNGSLNAYATDFDRQIVNPPWAEEAILHIRLLWGDDTLAELVQWAAMLGCLLGASLVAKLLGAGRMGQLAAALFSASLPLGILQATSTQNDYVAAYWLVCLLAFTLLCIQAESSWQAYAYLAGALGLGLLTKGTFYPYAAPVLAWLAIRLLRKVDLWRLLRLGLLIAALVLLLNLGYWWRNLSVFGGPLGPPEYVDTMTGSSLTPGYAVSAVARNILMNFVTPSIHINTRLRDDLYHVFGRFDPALKTFKLTWGWNHEDLAANPLHFLLVPLSLLVLFFRRKRLKTGRLWEYNLVVVSIFILLSVITHIDPFGLRYQLAYLVAAAPIFACALDALDRPLLTRAALVILLVLMLPWVVQHPHPPLVAFLDNPGPFTIPCSWHLGCGVRSVLVEPPATILFTNFTSYRDPYLQMAGVIKASGCKRVGFQIDSHDSEYFFWWLLDAPQSGVRIESVHALPELTRYLDPSYRPCVVICTNCSYRPRFHGLPLRDNYAGALLFMGDGYTAAP